jgi:hypothetical protein
MAVNYTTVVSPDDGAKTGGLGNRNQVNLKSCFPSSPIYSNVYTPTAAENAGISALNGNGGPGDSIPSIGIADGVLDDGGYMFNQVDLRFAGRRSSGVDDAYAAPNLSEVVTGGEGLPASPYIPNLTSPGEGNGTDPFAQSEFTGDLPYGGDPGQAAATQFGRGEGVAANPVTATAEVARATIGKFMLGTSKIT